MLFLLTLLFSSVFGVKTKPVYTDAVLHSFRTCRRVMVTPSPTELVSFKLTFYNHQQGEPNTHTPPHTRIFIKSLTDFAPAVSFSVGDKFKMSTVHHSLPPPQFRKQQTMWLLWAHLGAWRPRQQHV